jgi:hypothetical protein
VWERRKKGMVALHRKVSKETEKLGDGKSAGHWGMRFVFVFVSRRMRDRLRSSVRPQKLCM